MQGNIDQVVPIRAQLSEEVVDAEGGGADRSEGLVTPRVGEGGAPEVVGKEGGPRGSGAEVTIGQYGSPERKRKPWHGALRRQPVHSLEKLTLTTKLNKMALLAHASNVRVVIDKVCSKCVAEKGERYAHKQYTYSKNRVVQ